MNMNTTELAKALAEKTGLSQTKAKETLDITLGLIADAIVGNDEVALPVLGKIVAVYKPARQGRNPATGETIAIAASRKATFKASKALKDRLNGTV
jgi:DNA-binding protein HU-beta